GNLLSEPGFVQERLLFAPAQKRDLDEGRRYERISQHAEVGLLYAPVRQSDGRHQMAVDGRGKPGVVRVVRSRVNKGFSASCVVARGSGVRVNTKKHVGAGAAGQHGTVVYLDERIADAGHVHRSPGGLEQLTQPQCNV